MTDVSAENERALDSQPLRPAKQGGCLTKIVALLLSLAILIVLWSSARKTDLLDTLAQARLLPLLLAVVLMPIGLTVRGARLDVLLANSGRRIGVLAATSITFIGTSLNVLLPSNLGDVAKSYYAYRYNLAKEVALSVVIIDKVYAMTAAMLLGVLAALSQRMWGAAALAGMVTAGLVTLIFVPQLIPWRLFAWGLDKVLGKKLAHERALGASRFPAGTKLIAVLMSLVACSIAYTQYYLVCQSLGLNVSPVVVLVAAPLMDLSKAIPLTANGLGTREAVAVLMLGGVGVGRGDAMLSSLVFSAISLWAPAMVGAPLVWMAIHRSPAGRRAPMEATQEGTSHG